MKLKKLILIVSIFLFFTESFSQTDSLKTDAPLPENNKNDSIVKKSFNYSIDFFSFLRNTNFRDQKKTINPLNKVARLDYFDYGLYIRPEMVYEKKDLTIYFKPRYNIEYDQNNNDFILDDFYLQELKIKYNLANNSSITFGRYFKNIGTSGITNPSNVFFTESIALNPKLELRPLDFFEYKYSISHNWKLGIIANLSKGESTAYEAPFFDFYRKYAAQLENYNKSSQFSLLLAFDENKSYDIGFNGQRNINDALLVWIDGAFNYKPNRFYTEIGHSTDLLNYEMVNGKENEKLFFSSVVGSSYTFKFGPTLSLEYFFNGKGYNKTESNFYFDMITTASNYNFDITYELAKLNNGRAINNGLPFIRQNYIFSQFGQNDFLNQVNYFFRYFYCIDDNATQVSSLIEWDVIDGLEINTVFLFNINSEINGLNRLIKNQIMLGLIYRF